MYDKGFLFNAYLTDNSILDILLQKGGAKMTYFISDLHFGHRNILRFDCRPFSTIEEHDEYLINQWNDTVGADDDVWMLGDISWYSALKTVNILKRLNGKKHLCVGNHDHKLVKSADFQQQFVEIVDYKEISFGDGTGVVLCHYPIPCYNKHFYNWYHLYGHVHATFEWTMIEDFQNQMREQHQKKSQMYNVGCMMKYMNYRPRTFEEILEANN